MSNVRAIRGTSREPWRISRLAGEGVGEAAGLGVAVLTGVGEGVAVGVGVGSGVGAAVGLAAAVWMAATEAGGAEGVAPQPPSTTPDITMPSQRRFMSIVQARSSIATYDAPPVSLRPFRVG
jgi:hypothetical protein